MDELIFDGEKYVSSKRAAEITGYAKDYVGQLCRMNKVIARLVGRTWYIQERSLLEHSGGRGADSEQQEEEIKEDQNIGDIGNTATFKKNPILDHGGSEPLEEYKIQISDKTDAESNELVKNTHDDYEPSSLLPEIDKTGQHNGVATHISEETDVLINSKVSSTNNASFPYDFASTSLYTRLVIMFAILALSFGLNMLLVRVDEVDGKLVVSSVKSIDLEGFVASSQASVKKYLQERFF